MKRTALSLPVALLVLALAHAEGVLGMANVSRPPSATMEAPAAAPIRPQNQKGVPNRNISIRICRGCLPADAGDKPTGIFDVRTTTAMRY